VLFTVCTYICTIFVYDLIHIFICIDICMYLKTLPNTNFITAIVNTVTSGICKCKSSCDINWSGELSFQERANLPEILYELRLLLAIHKKNTTSYKRTLVSAEDNRVVSMSIGFSGVALLIMLITVITIVDLPNIIPQNTKSTAFVY